VSNGSDAGEPAGEHKLAKAGWHVYSWAGDRIATVVEAAADGLLVRLNSIDARELRVPAALVSSVDVADHRVTLSVDASELGVEPKTGQLDLSGDPPSASRAIGGGTAPASVRGCMPHGGGSSDLSASYGAMRKDGRRGSVGCIVA